MKTAVMTDTNSGITKQEADALGIFLMQMPVIIDGETHYEGLDLTHDSFFAALTGNQNVSTSQPSPGDVMDMWDEILNSGYDEIIYIPMSSGLSASCEAAMGLALDYDGKVQVANNHRISVTMRISVMEAKHYADLGASAAKIKELLETNTFNSSIYIAVGYTGISQKRWPGDCCRCCPWFCPQHQTGSDDPGRTSGCICKSAWHEKGQTSHDRSSEK